MSTLQLLNPKAVVPQGLERKRLWRAPPGATQALMLMELAQTHRRLIVAVCTDAYAAHQLEADLRALAPSSVRVLHFPDWETLVYDLFSPHPDLVSQRVSTLAELPQLQQQAAVLVVPVQTLMQRLAPSSYIAGSSFLLKVKQKLSLETERMRLDSAGYRVTKQVFEPGDYAIRGGLIDIFPMGAENPFRIEMFDDEIESIRIFDPESQRSLSVVQSIELLPAREFPFDQGSLRQVRETLLERFSLDPRRSALFSDLKQQIASPGIEYYLPLFFPSGTSTLFDYIGERALLVLEPDAIESGERFITQADRRYEQRAHDIDRPILPVRELFLDGVSLRERLNRSDRIILSLDAELLALPAEKAPALTVHRKDAATGADLKNFLLNFKGRVLLAADSAGRRESLRELLASLDLSYSQVADWSEFLAGPLKLALCVIPLSDGFVLPGMQLAVLTERQLYGERAQRERKKRGRLRDPASIVRDLGELAIGAPVVHEDHGVGRYRGLTTLDLDGVVYEFILLEYSGGDKLYVPVSNLDVISRYTGINPENAPLHSLNSDAWDKAKKRAAQKARDVAAELLEIYAKREAREGTSIQPDRNLVEQFSAAFPFEETPDQLTAIQSVYDDLRKNKPMDRLVCGDVGFGKTEVALRAAFAAATAGKQVAVLVPTTLLAQQHYQNFSDRFADWPVQVEVLSRFRSKKEVTEVLQRMLAGTVDVVIGTHKLLSDDIAFKDLGLVIVDEEQRFGVRDKDRLKKLRAEVDMLTLTATPIPRTLNFALTGLRDLSIISTPPKQRVAVKTVVSPWDSATLKEAFEREFSRGGQVYFLHNDVESMPQAERELQALVPQARIGVAHGQLPERELENTMLDFYRQRFNVLLCSTIIESGIDVPNANTIIIQRADKFGLAQLHQLRGRVGRSHHRAFAYLIVPPGKVMTADAEKRLQAIASLEELGAGFTLSTHDLEIRGAGELLGEEQSGQIAEVGFSLYTELLERAVKALKEGKIPDLDAPRDRGAKINLHAPVLLPNDYLPDVHERLVLYKRISGALDLEMLRELKIEVIDRFGLLPPPAQLLFDTAELKLQAQEFGIREIDLGPRGGRILFSPKPNIDPLKVIRLVQSEPKFFALEGQDKLKLRHELPEEQARLQLLRQVLEKISLNR